MANNSSRAAAVMATEKGIWWRGVHEGDQHRGAGARALTGGWRRADVRKWDQNAGTCMAGIAGKDSARAFGARARKGKEWQAGTSRDGGFNGTAEGLRKLLAEAIGAGVNSARVDLPDHHPAPARTVLDRASSAPPTSRLSAARVPCFAAHVL